MSPVRSRWTAVPLALTLALPVFSTLPAAAETSGPYLAYITETGPTAVLQDGNGARIWSVGPGVVDVAVSTVTGVVPTVVFVSERDTDTSYIDTLELRSPDRNRDLFTAPEGTALSEPTFSPDGGTVAFVLDDDTSSAVLTVDVASGTTRTVRRSTSTVYGGPSFSPDGSWLSWAQETATGSDLVTARLATGGASVLVGWGRTSTIFDSAWSPDGRQLVAAFTETAYGSADMVSSLMTVDLHTGQYRVVLRGSSQNGRVTSFGDPAWSPDGEAVYATKVQEAGGYTQASVVRLPNTPDGAFPDHVTTQLDYAGGVSAVGARSPHDDVAPAPPGPATTHLTGATVQVRYALPADPDVAELIVTRTAGAPADTPTASIEVARTWADHVDVALPAPDTDYGISVFARDWSGNVSRASTVAVHSPAASTVTVSTPPARTAYRTAVRMSGRVTASGVPVSGRAVLYARRAGTTTPIAVQSAPLAADGGYALTYTPQWTAEYQVRFSGSGNAYPAVSTKRIVSVVPLVSLSLSASRTAVGRAVTLAGGVAPTHAGQLVDVQRYVGNGVWRTIATTRLSSASQYRYALRPGSRGTWTLRVVKRADADHLLAVSPTRTLYVG